MKKKRLQLREWQRAQQKVGETLHNDRIIRILLVEMEMKVEVQLHDRLKVLVFHFSKRTAHSWLVVCQK